jgi:uncharacterized protein (TIGR00369 family)
VNNPSDDDAAGVRSPRERTYSWSDPHAAIAPDRLSGLEMLQRVFAGDLPAPPVIATLAIHAISIDSGEAVFAMDPAEFHYNTIGSVHGGVIATILDSAAGCAVHSTLAKGQMYTSIDLTVKYLRPVTITTARVHAIGAVVSRGSRTALAEARLIDATDRLLAHATSTCLISDRPD